MIEGFATAYCLDGYTCTGKEVREGIAAMSDNVGDVAIVYQRLDDGSIGNCLGIYEIEDTGCANGVIDIWRETLEDCQELMNDVYEGNNTKGKAYIQIIKAEG